MATTYLQIEGKTGSVFEYSKEESSGYEKHTSINGNVSYRRYLKKGLYGTLQNISVRDSVIGQQIQISVKNDEGEYEVLQLPLYNQTGNIDNRYAESLIRFLPILKAGQNYRFYPYAIEDNKTGYTTYGVSVREVIDLENQKVGEKVEPHLTYPKKDAELKETDIPRLEWKEIAGKNKPSAVSLEQKDEFLYKHLKQAVDGHLAFEGNVSSDNTTESNAKVETKVETKVEAKVEEDDDLDDLPF